MMSCGVLSVVFKVQKCTSHLGIGLVSERLWLETTRVVAMAVRSESPVKRMMARSRRGCGNRKSDAVWLNSTLGLLTILAQRTSTRGDWDAMKKSVNEKDHQGSSKDAVVSGCGAVWSGRGKVVDLQPLGDAPCLG